MSRGLPPSSPPSLSSQHLPSSQQLLSSTMLFHNPNSHTVPAAHTTAFWNTSCERMRVSTGGPLTVGPPVLSFHCPTSDGDCPMVRGHSHGFLLQILKQLPRSRCTADIPRVSSRSTSCSYKGSGYRFPQNRYKDGQWAHEKLLNIISHWEMQIKSMWRYHFIPTRKLE